MTPARTHDDRPLKLVQMPRSLLHLDDRDLDAAGIDPDLLAAFRSYLPHALDDQRGVVILAPAEAGAHHLLMVLARRIGIMLRDANIHLREHGGDLKLRRQKLCYLPGHALATVLSTPSTRHALVSEAACFLQDLDQAWRRERSDSGGPGSGGPGSGSAGSDGFGAGSPESERVGAGESGSSRLGAETLLSLLDARLAGGHPTFLTAAPDRLPPALEAAIRARLPILAPRTDTVTS